MLKKRQTCFKDLLFKVNSPFYSLTGLHTFCLIIKKKFKEFQEYSGVIRGLINEHANLKKDKVVL